MKVEVTVLKNIWVMLWEMLTQEEVELKVWMLQAGAQVIRAMVPLSEMFGYATDIKIKNSR